MGLIRNFCYFRTWTDSLFKTRKIQEKVTSRTSGILQLELRDIGEKYVDEYIYYVGIFTNIQKRFHQHTSKFLSSPTYSTIMATKMSWSARARCERNAYAAKGGRNC